MQLCCKRKIYKEKYRMFAGDSQMLRNKHHFVISMIAIIVFYSIMNIQLHIQASKNIVLVKRPIFENYCKE